MLFSIATVVLFGRLQTVAENQLLNLNNRLLEIACVDILALLARTNKVVARFRELVADPPKFEKHCIPNYIFSLFAGTMF